MSDTEAPPGDDGGAHDADHPMLDSDGTDTASVADDQPPPPAQRRRTGDLLGPMGRIAADADPPIQVFPQMTPAPATDAGVAAKETDLATLDGSAQAARQVSSYAAVHSRLRAPTAASTLGRIGASPTGLGFTGVSTRARSHTAAPPLLAPPSGGPAAPAPTTRHSEMVPDPIPEGFVSHLVDLAPALSPQAAAAALQEARQSEPVLWNTWTTCGDGLAIPGALLPSLDRILRRHDDSCPPAGHWVPHTDVDVAIASMPDSCVMEAGYLALLSEVLHMDGTDAHAPLDHILTKWASSLPASDLDRHRSHGVPLTPVALHLLTATTNR